MGNPELVYNVMNLISESIKAATIESDNGLDSETQASLIAFIRGVDFGKNVEEQFKFFELARNKLGSEIPGINQVFIEGVMAVMNKTINFTKGRGMSPRIEDFLKSCAAYCYITLPDIEDNNTKYSISNR
jgi:hypothetical protein